MIREELKHLSTAPKDLRKFGLLVGAVFGLIVAWCWWRGKSFYPYFLVPSLPLLGLGLIWPKSLKWPYIAWMSLALFLGFIVSTIILTVFYFVVLTPVGLLARISGKDFLSRRFQPEVESYWMDRRDSKQRRSYEQQF